MSRARFNPPRARARACEHSREHSCRTRAGGCSAFASLLPSPRGRGSTGAAEACGCLSAQPCSPGGVATARRWRRHGSSSGTRSTRTTRQSPSPRQTARTKRAGPSAPRYVVCLCWCKGCGPCVSYLPSRALTACRSRAGCLPPSTPPRCLARLRACACAHTLRMCALAPLPLSGPAFPALSRRRSVSRGTHQVQILS